MLATTHWYKGAAIRLVAGCAPCLTAMLLALAGSGCAQTKQNSVYAKGGAANLLPELTAVTSGPLAVLLTNGTSYSAQFALTSQDISGKPRQLTGPILASAGKIRMEFSQSNGKLLPEGNIDVIWDNTTHQGYLLCEALQGYAPISEVVGCTNILTHLVPGPASRMNGHPIVKAMVTLQCADGQTMAFQLSRAPDLSNLPLQLSLAGQPASLTLTLTKVQDSKLPDDLFLPPEEFKKYVSATALVTELAFREQGVENGGGKGSEPLAPSPNMPKFGAMPRSSP